MLIWIIDEEWSEYEYEIKKLNEEFEDLDLRFSSYDYEKDLEEFGYRADGILAQVYADIDRKLIDRLENCKGIAVYGGGFDKVDIEACKEKNIHVTNIQGYCAEDLADYVLAGIYNANKLQSHFATNIKRIVEDGLWGAPSIKNRQHRLSESTLFIVGLGAIGTEVAKKAGAVGMKLTAFDEYVGDEKFQELGVTRVSWEEGFSSADYISINLKGAVENTDKVAKKEFDMMKENAYLINTARGRIIKEEDLIEAVKGKKIRGALLDVVKNEPPEADNPILNTENIMVTPHNSYISIESMQALKIYAVDNLISMLRGEEPRDFVV